MAFDEQLAERIRKGLAGHRAVEKRMFGGLCFMVKGAMCCGVHKNDFIARVGSERHDEALGQAHARLMDITGRPVRGMIAGNEQPRPLPILFKEPPDYSKGNETAHSRIPNLVKRVLANPHFDPAGHHIGRAQMILGLFYKVKKKRALALQHLTEARRILSQFGQTARVDTALAELEQ